MYKKVVVIGAGAAGIAAATKLLELGLRNVVILEAEGRIGGRIHTIPFASNVVDLGAQWCHGEKDNVVYQLASKRNLLDSSSEDFYDFLCVKSNKEVVPKDIVQRLEIISTGIFEDSEALAKYKGSVGDYFQERYYDVISKPENSDIDRITADQFYEFVQKMENSVDCSDSLFDLSTDGFIEYHKCEGDNLLNWKDKGYVTILHLLMGSEGPHDLGVLNNRIIFNKTVERIEWDRQGAHNASIKCTDGEIIEADHIICTVSLGVLKEQHSKLFVPKLPEEKLRAIEGLGFGTVGKMFLEFSPKFWPENWPGICLLWEKDDLEKVRRGSKPWLEDVIGIYTEKHQPNVLCAWIFGENARRVEAVPEAEVIDGILSLLRMFLEHEIPEPVAFKRSVWYNNLHFRGCYSFRSMKSEELQTNASQLSAPLGRPDSTCPVLLFAGEATHDHFYSTVHGAIESGWREAQRLSNFYNNLFHQPAGNDSHAFDVLILGAGLAGLGAAFTLKGSGKKFVILEAQDYIGGRVRTTRMLNYKLSAAKPSVDLSDVVDSGAQWLHGEQNELYRVAREHNLLLQEVSEEGLGLYIREDGFQYDDFLRKKVDFVFGSILEKCEAFVTSAKYPPSIEAFVEEEFHKYLDTLACPKEKEHSRQLFDWHRRFQIIDNSCLTLRDVSAKFWGSYSYNGESCQAHINFTTGFSSVVDALAERIGRDLILTKKEVCDISWNVISNENGLINVCTADGALYSAKHLIVTFSLGVLKHREQKLFAPQLPLAFTKAIRDAGFEAIDKIFLQFDHPWWGDTEGFQLVFKDDDYKNKPWTRYLSGFDVLRPGPPNTLLGWVGSYGAIEMEKFNDEEVVSDCIELLRKFTSLQIPQPIKYYCSRWGCNSFIRGGYSYISTKCDSTFSTGEVLSSPVTIDHLPKDKSSSIVGEFKDLCLSDKAELIKSYPLLLFAGEACHEQYFSTAHGAFLSGEQQAKKILKYFL